MAFNASFEIIPSNNPSLIILSDNSTGSDAGLTGRTIYIYDATGNLFVPAVSWAIANTSITLDILSSDQALNIRCDWASSAPLSPPSSYTYSKINAFVLYGQQYAYSLTMDQAANPSIAQDQNFYQNKLQLFCEILAAQNAIDIGASVFNAQLCIDRYTYLINNSQYFF